jgi:hypothetical protein
MLIAGRAVQGTAAAMLTPGQHGDDHLAGR